MHYKFTMLWDFIGRIMCVCHPHYRKASECEDEAVKANAHFGLGCLFEQYSMANPTFPLIWCIYIYIYIHTLILIFFWCKFVLCFNHMRYRCTILINHSFHSHFAEHSSDVIMECFHMAASYGSPAANYRIGECYHKGINGIQQVGGGGF